MTDPYQQIVSAYSDGAEKIARKYTAYDRSVMLPGLDGVLEHESKPKRILDIGAGNGVDALSFAKAGHLVTAVEPSDLRLIGAVENAHPNISWIDDLLPDMATLSGQEGVFDLVLLNRVFMHVQPDDQVRALKRTLEFVAPRGTLYMIVRHGPSMDNRAMFPVDLVALQTAVATLAGFEWTDSRADYPDYDNRPDVTWSVTIITRR